MNRHGVSSENKIKRKAKPGCPCGTFLSLSKDMKFTFSKCYPGLNSVSRVLIGFKLCLSTLLKPGSMSSVLTVIPIVRSVKPQCKSKIVILSTVISVALVIVWIRNFPYSCGSAIYDRGLETDISHCLRTGI